MMGTGSSIRGIAVKGGRIAALGADRQAVVRQAPAGSEVLDLPEGCVLPGFWDTHVHVASLGAAAAGCWLYDAGSIDELVQRVAHYAGQNPDVDVIACHASNLDAAVLAEGRLPTAADLGRAERERPVVISDVNKCVGNSAALAAAGLSAQTPAPEGGIVERDERGRPTGVAWFAAKALLGELLSRGRPVAFAERFVAGLEALAARGLSTVVDGYATVEQIETVRRLDGEGRLPCRVIVQPAARSEGMLHELEASGLEFGQQLGPMSRVGPAKVFYDGFVMHRTARMSAAYRGQPRNFGDYFLPPRALARRLCAVFDLGFPVAVHVTGDQGMRELLDAFARELERRGGRVPSGSYLIHGYYPPQGAPERMAALGVGLAAQPAFLHHWADTLERFVGRRRAERFCPLDEYLAGGVVVGAGSDAPVADPDPLLGLRAMSTRRSASGRIWGRGHALPTARALELYTGAAARLFSWSGFASRLAVGEPADLVVLDRDPTTTSPDDIGSIRVLATFVAGRETFRRGAHAP